MLANRLITFALVIMLGVIIALTTSMFSAAKKAKNNPIDKMDPWPFEAVPQLLPKRELLFFRALEENLPAGFRALPRVRLMSFVGVSPGARYYDQFQARIGRRYVDFLIVDAEHLQPAAAIEYDDGLLDKDKTAEKVRDMERILDGANILLFRFPDKPDLFAAEDFTALNEFLSGGGK